MKLELNPSCCAADADVSALENNSTQQATGCSLGAAVESSKRVPELVQWLVCLCKNNKTCRLLLTLCMCVFLTEYCMEHWREDWFFGYQCLNGSNPRMIRRCNKLPENFPVTPDMVQRSMAPRTNLNKELKVETFRKCTPTFLTCFNVNNHSYY